MFVCEGASAAGAGGQGAGGEDQLHRQQGQTPRLQSLRLTEDPPGDRHLPHSVSPLYTLCREGVGTANTVLSRARSIARGLAVSLSGFWMDCHENWCGHTCPPEIELGLDDIKIFQPATISPTTGYC